MLEPQYVTGCLWFKNKRDRKQKVKQLKEELGNQVKLRLQKEGRFIIYSYKEVV